MGQTQDLLQKHSIGHQEDSIFTVLRSCFPRSTQVGNDLSSICKELCRDIGSCAIQIAAVSSTCDQSDDLAQQALSNELCDRFTQVLGSNMWLRNTIDDWELGSERSPDNVTSLSPRNLIPRTRPRSNNEFSTLFQTPAMAYPSQKSLQGVPRRTGESTHTIGSSRSH